MRLYFTDGKREIGFDTDNQVWTDEKDKKFMHDKEWPHRFLYVSTEVIENIDKELDFNMWGYSKGLKEIKR